MSYPDGDTPQDFSQEHFYEEGVAGGMHSSEVDEFLASADSTWLIKLATIKEDGWPMVVPLWYQWSNGAFFVVGRKRSLWVQDLIGEPRCSICIEEMAHPRIRKVLAQCTAEIVEGPAIAEGSAWLPIAEEMACRYAGPDGAEQLTPSHDWERYLVRLVPREGRLTTWQGADWAARYFDPGQRPDLEAIETQLISDDD